MININPINIADNFKLDQGSKQIEEPNKENFSNYFNKKLQEVNQLQKDSQKMTADFAVGKTDNIHQVMISAEKAKIAVNLTTAVQSKAIDAYKEIMRLQV
ncbi:Flagellar hook-basal body complex protein FliE [Halanaerobium saccharolyticum subsp. saccharolyticum DSM 6643]|uniref:Flagellar hook-basal body complex protein FliE n=1 Tax=Halanaerobium saccharolyticum subsp. saccharolyticum DSM 6643 TaxID=1293054 RepID=M5E2P0_9FIRM|nr:flagellar hook-basal body complex protein FliE [Halanaerobium saccharolyticum]CCU80791.1 Flagellar hook-basal body complex protein FliE [Halanaerobium saccharolyticum subsp. saccharolyticum DSM 6643]